MNLVNLNESKDTLNPGLSVCSSVSNGKGQCNFLGQRDNGTSYKSCQGTLEPKVGTGRDGTAEIRDETHDITEKSRKDVLRQEKMF